MASASRAKLVMTSMPTLSSFQASDRRCAMFSPLSLQETLNIFVFGPSEHFIRALKNNLAIAKHQKPRIRDTEKIVLSLKMNLSRTVGCVLGGHRKCIQHAVCNKHTRNLLGIAQCNDQFIDLLRCNGIESRRRFIVQHNAGFADQSACKCNAPFHASGEFARHFVDGLNEADESENLAHPLFYLTFIGVQFVQPVCNILTNRQRIEERRLLEHHSDFLSDTSELALVHFGDVFAFNENLSFIRFVEAHDELENCGLARPACTDDDFRFASVNVERHAVQHRFIAGVVLDDVSHLKYRFHHLVYSRIKRVRNRSNTRIKTDDATTAWVVDRPTPWVPP